MCDGTLPQSASINVQRGNGVDVSSFILRSYESSLPLQVPHTKHMG